MAETVAALRNRLIDNNAKGRVRSRTTANLSASITD
jgi:hypothetical protein